MTKEGYTSNERIKEESDFLRGNISDLLHDDSITHFPSEEEFLLKFHGLPSRITGMNGLSGRKTDRKETGYSC